MTLNEWLERIEQLHARPIDLGLDRVRAVRDRLGFTLDALTFTVAGTNGKGSTCHMLESITRAAGYRVGCYTSPHLVQFNERARIDGEPVSDALLIEQFEAVDAARQDTTLTYFEFTTLAILRLFAQQGLDVAILEIGLGGRLDAVNIVDADVSIITAIDVDHAELLGDTREKIGVEKAHVMRAGRPAIVGDPQPPASVIEHANTIGADLWCFGRDYNYSGDAQQWSYGGRSIRRNAMAYPALRGANQLLNASGVLAALESVKDRLPVSQQAVREGFARVEVPGRFQVLPGKPTVILDVGHNPHAAAHLARNLSTMGYFPYTWAVFGMLADKDIAGAVRHLKPVIDHWIACSLPGPRGSDSAQLVAQLAAEGIPGADHSVRQAASPAEGLELARKLAGPDDRIIVFGSFLTVAGVMTAPAASA